MNKIRFLHIPKTAGSAFDESLSILYLKDYILRRRFIFTGNFQSDRQRYAELSRVQREKTKLYLGHAPRITGIAEVDSLPTITLLRHPVDRVKSFCQHVNEEKSPTIPKGAVGQDMDIDGFLSSGRVQLSNFQSRTLLGNQGYDLPSGNIDDLVDGALQVLENELCTFGITEHFSRSMLLFSRILGWDESPLYRPRNVKNASALLVFQDRHIEKIIELNQLDLQVYRRACSLFEVRLEQHYPDIVDDLARYERLIKQPHGIFRAIDIGRVIAAKIKLL